jgi:hypothetical protein
MIHQNHLPLDQRLNEHDGNRAAVSGSRRTMVYFSCLRSSPAIEAARSVHYQTNRSAVILVQLAKEYWASSDDTHETTVIASPVLFPLYTCQFPHQISAPLFLCSLLLFLIERFGPQEVWKHARKDQ